MKVKTPFRESKIKTTRQIQQVGKFVIFWRFK